MSGSCSDQRSRDENITEKHSQYPGPNNICHKRDDDQIEQASEERDFKKEISRDRKRSQSNADAYDQSLQHAV